MDSHERGKKSEITTVIKPIASGTPDSILQAELFFGHYSLNKYEICYFQ